MTSDTRPSVLAIDVLTLERAMRELGNSEVDCRLELPQHAEEWAPAIAAEYSRLLEERVAPESESELREAFGK